MKTLNEYIVDQQDNMMNESLTANNQDRKKQLEDWLKGQNYSDYVDTLNEMLKDPKAKVLLSEGFGGELGDYKLRFKVRKIAVNTLRPTQSEIDINKSLDYCLKVAPKANLDKYFSDEVIINFPLVTFRHNYVIDGHHRWSQVFAFNPGAKMVCFDYDGDISPIQMLKATQGAIAAVKADPENDNNGEIPSEVVEGTNLFDKKFTEKKIEKYIKDTGNEEFFELYPEYVEEKTKKQLNSKEEVAAYVAENLIQLKSNNYPEQNSPKRGDMPQTDRGGEDPNNPKTSLPDNKDSALGKLKNGPFVKNAVQ
jgi:hypothetical protein